MSRDSMRERAPRKNVPGGRHNRCPGRRVCARVKNGKAGGTEQARGPGVKGANPDHTGPGATVRNVAFTGGFREGRPWPDLGVNGSLWLLC